MGQHGRVDVPGVRAGEGADVSGMEPTPRILVWLIVAQSDAQRTCICLASAALKRHDWQEAERQIEEYKRLDAELAYWRQRVRQVQR